MVHHLTPDFILANAKDGNDHGQFRGVALFADISGFTPLTRALMVHGNEGAETIAAVLSAVFDPLIEIVFAHGGFIAGFAGDAFKAIFPVGKSSYAESPRGSTEGQRAFLRENDARYRAIGAAWEIRAHMRNHHTHETRFGAFNFDVTLCVADGDVTWEILAAQLDEHDQQNRARQQMACLIEGSALAHCLALDPYAQTGEVLLSSGLAARLDPAWVKTEMLDYGARLVALEPEKIGQIIDAAVHQLAAPYLSTQAARFHPVSLLKLKTQGEFRRVVTLFFDLQTLPEAEQRPVFEADFFRLLRQYDGYLCRVGRAGDWGSAATFLIFWGAPTGHENDNQRALDFALNLLAACPTPARAGITTNLAYAGFVGGTRHEEYTCYGNYVNLAARQTKAADWGEIWLDRETARQAEGAFTTAALGTREFKGFQEPRPVIRLLARADDHRPRLYHNALIGRNAELAQLRRACDPIFAGRFGGIMTVIGEAGMGKSRLVHEFQRQLADEEATTGQAVSWFLCQTDEILRQPLNPIRYFLRHYFAQTDTMEEGEHKRRFDATLDGLIAATNDDALRTELQRVRSFLGALVDLHWTDSLYAQLDPQLRFENTIEALKSFIKAESLRQPLILQVEDVHWLDPDTVTALARLMRNVADYPFMIVATTRPSTLGSPDNKLSAAIPEDAPSAVVKLGTLDDEQLDALAADLLAGPLAPALSSLLKARADGNPFFVEQIVLYLREQKLLIRADDRWAMRGDDAGQAASQAVLSGDVRAVLTARLDRLDSPVREVVQTAAVLGREFDERVLAHMMERDQQLPDRLASASEAAVWSAVEQTRYMFRHALLRDAAYDMQLRATLRTLHAKAGSAIEEVHGDNLPPLYADLVHHYRQSEARTSERRYAELAGEYAAEQFANEDALGYLSRALDLTGDSDIDRRYRLLLSHESVANTSGRREDQKTDIDLMRRIADESMSPEQAIAAMLRQAHYLRVTNDYASALAVGNQALIIAQTTGDPPSLMNCQNCLGQIAWRQNRYSEAEEHLQYALRVAQDLGKSAEIASNQYMLGLVNFYRADYKRALRKIEAASEGYNHAQDAKGAIQCLYMFGVINQYLGEYSTAQSFHTQGLSQCRRIGWSHMEAHFLTELGNNYFEVGDYALAQEYHKESLALCNELADREGEAISLDTLGLIAYMRGCPREAVALIARAVSIQQEIGDKHGLGYSLTHLGFARLADDEHDQAGEAFESALGLRQEIGETGAAVDSLAGLALVQLKRGSVADANAMANEIRNRLTEANTDGIEFPVNVYLICYQIFAASTASDPDYQDLALQSLMQGYDLLQKRAAAIVDPTLRTLFLRNVPYNRALITAWRVQTKESQVVE